MKVLHICSYYITSKLYQNLVSELNNLDIYNDIYIPINSDELINKNYKEGINKSRFIYSKCFTSIDRINFKKKTNKIYNDLLKKVDFKEIDITHAHSLFVNGYISYKVKKEKNIDYIVAIRNTDVNVFFKYMPWMRAIGIDIMKSAKNVIFISPSYKDQVINNYVPTELREQVEAKSVVVPNGVDKFWLENLYSLKVDGEKRENHKLIYVGNIDKNKNIYMTIKAIELLIKKGYNIKFDIIGEGKEKKKIKRIIEKNSSKHIEVHDYMTKEDLINKYRSSDIFVMPSKTETFGLVYVEALTQGVPVIYTKGQGFDGFFKDGDIGLSVNHNDYIELSEKIEFILNNRIDISKFSNEIKESFDWKSIAKIYKNLYWKKNSEV